MKIKLADFGMQDKNEQYRRMLSSMYYMSDISEIVEATVAGQAGYSPQVFRGPHYNQVTEYSHQNMAEAIQGNILCYGSIEASIYHNPDLRLDDKTEYQQAASILSSLFLEEWRKAHPNGEVGTFVFSAKMSDNHFGVYALTTDGEIMVINSMGSGGYDAAAIQGIQSALNSNNIEPQETIKITAEKDITRFKQPDGISCGAITTAMMLAIAPGSLKAQQGALESHMEKLCSTTGTYQARREQKQVLQGYHQGKNNAETIKNNVYHKPSVVPLSQQADNSLERNRLIIDRAEQARFEKRRAINQRALNQKFQPTNTNEPIPEVNKPDSQADNSLIINDLQISDRVKSQAEALLKALPLVTPELLREMTRRIAPIDKQARLKAEIHAIVYDNSPNDEIMAKIRDFCNDPNHRNVEGLQQINAIDNQLPVLKQIQKAIEIAKERKSEHPKSTEEKFYSDLSTLKLIDPESVDKFLNSPNDCKLSNSF